MVKRLSTMQETQVRFLGQEDNLEKEMAIHSSMSAWEIPWTEEPVRLQFMVLQKSNMTWLATKPACMCLVDIETPQSIVILILLGIC